MRLLSAITLTIICALSFGCVDSQRKSLFYPSHHKDANGLEQWIEAGEIIGYARRSLAPKNIWLLLHGNAGQATDRAYTLPCFSPSDSVYILEYPGYGNRPGSPSKDSFNDAAAKAYSILLKKFPDKPVCVAGESIGSGPASFLATQDPPPAKIVLTVPFDRLSDVAAEHLNPSIPVRLIMKDNWNNAASLSNYSGQVEIFGAIDDEVIPITHARSLADKIPRAKFHRINGGHNDWSQGGFVQFRNP